MKFRKIEQQVESLSITTAHNSPTIDVCGGGNGTVGGDSIAFFMVASSGSTPGTATISLNGSLDGANWILIGTAVAVSANGSYVLTQDRPPYRYYRVAYAIASGSYTSTLRVLVKGDAE